MLPDPPSKNAFDNEETREQHTRRTKNIAPTRLNRELQTAELEHILDMLDGATWVPNNRVEIDGGREHEYSVIVDDTGESFRLWHLRDGNIRRRNAIRTEPGFPDDLEWSVVEGVFRVISDNRRMLREAKTGSLDDQTTVQTPTQYLLNQSDAASRQAFIEAQETALDELIDTFEELDDGDYDALETAVRNYQQTVGRALDHLGDTTE